MAGTASLPRARRAAPAGAWAGAADAAVRLDYEGRFLRRRRLVTEAGWALLADLPAAASLGHGDALVLDDGRHVVVEAAAEPVLVIRGDLPRLAWHIGNRHTPCEIGRDALVIRADHVLEAMLRRLGAALEPAIRPFTPEGGAYGHGRTMGHHHHDPREDPAGADHHHHHHHSHDRP